MGEAIAEICSGFIATCAIKIILGANLFSLILSVEMFAVDIIDECRRIIGVSFCGKYQVVIGAQYILIFSHGTVFVALLCAARGSDRAIGSPRGHIIFCALVSNTNISRLLTQK